jgi:uncharacterized membrane protein YqjE
MQIDPDVGIPDLVRRLTEDSKRLANDEVRLGKLEMRENIHQAARGGLWLGLAFGAAVVAMVALTITLITVIGRLTGNYWAGALIVAVLELGLGYWSIKRGMTDITEPSYSFEESRESLKDTAAWVKSVR